MLDVQGDILMIIWKSKRQNKKEDEKKTKKTKIRSKTEGSGRTKRKLCRIKKSKMLLNQKWKN